MSEVILAEQGGANNIGTLGDYAGDEYRNRQKFVLSENATLSKVTTEFGANSGSPSGQVVFRIETDNAGQASGTLVHANATVTFTPTPSAINTMNFDDFSIVAGTYWLVWNCDNQSSNVSWQQSLTSPGTYADGIAGRTTNGSWSTDAGYDWVFAVYGIIPGGFYYMSQ